jgi:hypothetical protein
LPASLADQAAARAEALTALGQRWRDGSPSGRPSAAGGPSGGGSQPGPGQASGAFRHTLSEGEGEALSGKIDWQQVPAEYRDRVGAYFNRLNEDQAADQAPEGTEP